MLGLINLMSCVLAGKSLADGGSWSMRLGTESESYSSLSSDDSSISSDGMGWLFDSLLSLESRSSTDSSSSCIIPWGLELPSCERLPCRILLHRVSGQETESRMISLRVGLRVRLAAQLGVAFMSFSACFISANQRNSEARKPGEMTWVTEERDLVLFGGSV